MRKKVMVLGSGIAGIKASLELAKRGISVVLVERSPFFGGKLPFLDRQFPTDVCGMCRTLPTLERTGLETCLKGFFYHPLIELVLYGEVVRFSGSRGEFAVDVRVKNRGVKDNCNGCGRCIEVCPQGAVVFGTLPGFPNIPAIDWDRCTRCGLCVDACPVGAIELDGSEKLLSFFVDSLVVAWGFEQVNPHTLSQYGYGRFGGVVTSMEFEEMLRGELPENLKVAFVLCAGSRDLERGYCSSTCCMYSIKQARLLKEKIKSSEPVIFYMDLRAYGLYHSYAVEAERRGVRFVRGRVPKIWEDPKTKKLILRVLSEDGVREELFDMAVLALGKVPPEGSGKLSDILGIELDDDGFVKVREGVRTSRDGVYVCGCALSPADIASSVVQAEAVAFSIAGCESYPAQREDAPRDVAVLLCRCGGAIDTERAKSVLEGFARVFEVDSMCLGEIPDDVKGFKKLLIGACSGALKPKVLSLIPGVNPRFVEWVNLKAFNERALLFSYEVLKRKNGEFSSERPERSVLVVGGGLSGLLVSLNLARCGLKVHLVEKEDSLGGALKGRPSKSELLKELLDGLDSVEVHLESRVFSFEGSLGRFRAQVEGPHGRFSLDVGASVLATGSLEYVPREFSYGSQPKVVTQRELEGMLWEGKSFGKVVMVQCVGSRSDESPWCSRYCCVEAIENALSLRERGSEVYIFCRDIVTCGLHERLYRKARESGVVFLREDVGNVSFEGDSVKIRVGSTGMHIHADLLVLSTGTLPNPENPEISKVFKVELGREGFLSPADPKFRPLEAAREGIFLCGGCMGPFTWDEVELQAYGVSQLVSSLLLRDELKPSLPVSCVKERRCSGCGVCVDMCPFGARELVGGIARVNKAACQGCGVCVSACPNGASELLPLEKKDFCAAIERMLGG